jgi:hypothetical protein
VKIINFLFNDATQLSYRVEEDSNLLRWSVVGAAGLALLSYSPNVAGEQHGLVWEQMLLYSGVVDLKFEVRKNQIIYALPMFGGYPYIGQLILDAISAEIPG